MEALVLLMGGKRGALAAIVAALLLVAVAGQGAWLWARGTQIAGLEAAASAHAGQLQARDDRLGTLRGQVATLTSAAQATRAEFDKLKALYDALALEAGVRAKQDAAALARARAAAADADRALKAFMARYQASYTGDCRAAIDRLDVACPVLTRP